MLSGMKKVLMILTKDRRDCVDMNLLLHERGGSFEVFDHVVFLLNDVTPGHMRFIDSWIRRHPNVACDKILGDGSRPKGISDMQNRCIEKYPDAFYAKTDEDVFVQPGWARSMWEAYRAHQHRDDLALITPLLPNNSYGLYVLLNQFYPDYLEEHRRRFNRDPEPRRDGFTWHNPGVAEWATRKFINLQKANEEQLVKLQTQGSTFNSRLPASNSAEADSSLAVPPSSYHHFSMPFSIGCIGYDYRHWEKMGGIPETDEPGWCKWIEENHQVNILDCRQIALHYTFFVQQEWLDRSTILENIRSANLADTVTLADRLQIHRLHRITRQIPSIVKRKWKVLRS